MIHNKKTLKNKQNIKKNIIKTINIKYNILKNNK